MDHLDLAGVLTTPPQWNLQAFEQQDAIYLSSSRQMLEPILEETSEDEEYALNSWQQYEQPGSDVDCEANAESESNCGVTGGAGGASFWSSAESDTGSVIRVEINKDNDSNSERDFLCPAKRPRRCEESLSLNLNEEEVILRRPLYADLKHNSLERFLNYENYSRDSWGNNSQQRSSVNSRRGFDDFYSDSDSLSYNSLSRSSSLIQFESLERQLLIQEQHASLNSLGNSSPSLLSFETNEENTAKISSSSANNSASNSRRGSQASLLKKYESLDGRLHQTYFDLDKLSFDDRNHSNSDSFSRHKNLKISSHMAELRSDSESSSEGSEGSSSRAQNMLSNGDSPVNDFIMKKCNRTNCQQSKKGKNSAENLSEDSGYCEPSLGFGLRRSKSQSLLKNYEKFSEEEEEMENKSLLFNSNSKPQMFIELKEEQQVNSSNIHNIFSEFKNINTRQATIKSPPLSPHLEFIRHKQRTEAHSPSPVSSEVSTSSSSSSSAHSTNSNNSHISSTTASSTSSNMTCASKASFTWLMPSVNTNNNSATNRQSSSSSSARVLAAEENSLTEISLNDLRDVQTSYKENVQILNGKFQNIKEFSSPVFTSPSISTESIQFNAKPNESLDCKNIVENGLKECQNCGEHFLVKQENSNIFCHKCKENLQNNFIICTEKNNEYENLNCKKCAESFVADFKLDSGGGFNKKVCKKLNSELLTDSSGEFEQAYDLTNSTPVSFKTFTKSCESHSCGSANETINKTPPVFIDAVSDYSPLRLRKNFNSLMQSWPVKTSSVPTDLNTLGRNKEKLKRNKTCKNKINGSDSDFVVSNDDFVSSNLNINRSISCSFDFSPQQLSCLLEPEAKNFTLIHQSYHNLAALNLDFDFKSSAPTMAEKRISSDYETEIVCKNNFLLDELSAHFDRTSSILTDKPLDETDKPGQLPKLPVRAQNRKSSSSSSSAMEDSETDQVQHVSLVIRQPPARQKFDISEEKTNSLIQDLSFASLMQKSCKTFDQDPTVLKTSYAQSLEKCNFDCREISTQDLSQTRNIPKRRFQSQANNSKKKNLVSSTPNLNAYDFNHQDDIEDDMFVSSAHTSMHQLPLSQTQKPLGILLPAGSRSSFGKEVSFCPVVSKYCWQEQSSEECNDGNEGHKEIEDDSEDELLDNADATVIHNTKENENIASKYNEEILKRMPPVNIEQEGSSNGETLKEKAVLRELNIKQLVENIMLTEENSMQRDLFSEENETLPREQLETKSIQNEQHGIETEVPITETPHSNEPAQTTVSLITNVNNETLTYQTDRVITEQNKRVNNNNTTNTLTSTSAQSTTPTVVVARPLSIQLPILSEPPINRAHHILYASQQMLDNFQRQQENEEYEHFKSQSTQNLNNMSTGKFKDIIQPQQQQQLPTSNTKLNNNNELMKTKFKHEEKHPNSKGFLSRFANGFRFSLRRNKKKLQQKEMNSGVQQQEELKSLNQNRSNSLPAQNKQADFIHIPLKGPLTESRNVNSKLQTNGNYFNNGNAKNSTAHFVKQKGAKTKDSNEKQQKVTGKPPIPPQQQQQHPQQQYLQKLQSAQSSLQQQQPLLEVGLSRFYTETESLNQPSLATPQHSVTQDFLNSERGLYNENNVYHNQQQFTTTTGSNSSISSNNQSCANNHKLLTGIENDTNMTAVNANSTAYEFSSPSRATVSQKTQMFNNLSRKSDQPKIGLIETNLDTHETIITGKTRSLINIGPTNLQQQRYACNKRLHTNNNSYNQQQQEYNRHHLHGNQVDDYDDNDDDEVVVRPDGTVVVIKNAGTNGSSSSSQAAQIASVRRPHKSMEFLLDKENQKDVMTTSEDSETELNCHDVSNSGNNIVRKKKLRHTLDLKKYLPVTEKPKICSTDSDSDSKIKNVKVQSCTMPKAKKSSYYIKKLFFKPLKPFKPHSDQLNKDVTISQLDSSLIRQVNSPTKIKTAYTLTAMSSPSSYSGSDFNDSELTKKFISRSWPSILETDLDDDSGFLKYKSCSIDFKVEAKTNLLQEQQKLLIESFADRGFPTESTEMDSPVKIIKSALKPENFSTPHKTSEQLQVFTDQPNFSPITTNSSPPESAYFTQSISKEDLSAEFKQEDTNTASSLSETASYFRGSNYMQQPRDGSKFWITSGDFTASITIHHYESECLMVLRNTFAEKSLGREEMHFGIDEYTFYMDSSAVSDKIMKQVYQEENCSQYWFSTGFILITFKGPQMPARRIKKFFNYIREFMEETDSLSFGIDDYEFSYNAKQTHTSITPLSSSPWTKIITSPLKTSDLDQSDFDSEKYDQSRRTSSSLSGKLNTSSFNSDYSSNVS